MGNPNNRGKGSKHASSTSRGSIASSTGKSNLKGKVYMSCSVGTKSDVVSVSSEIEPFPAAPPNLKLPASPRMKSFSTDKYRPANGIRTKSGLVQFNRYGTSIIFSSTGVRNSTRTKAIHYTSNLSDDPQSSEQEDIRELITNLDPSKRNEFWERNWIEIHINFKKEEEENEKDGIIVAEAIKDNENNAIIAFIESLCPDITASATTIFINIQFPVIDDSNPLETTVPTASNSANYSFIEGLVETLNSFKALNKLQIILHTPPGSQNPLPLQNLLYVLPFYDLEFTHWSIAWKTSFMTNQEIVRGWPIKHLDRERNRILYRRRAEKEEDLQVKDVEKNEAKRNDAIKDNIEEKREETWQDNGVKKNGVKINDVAKDNVGEKWKEELQDKSAKNNAVKYNAGEKEKKIRGNKTKWQNAVKW
ncbi:hypothetical protein B7463_g2878, partial [Scytalidium lignicola]